MLVLLALGAGLLLVLAFPPFDLGFLAVVAFVGYFWVIRRTRRPGWASFVFGVAFYGGLLWWLSRLGLVAVVPFVLVLALYLALYGWALGKVSSRLSDLQWWVVASGGWALMELARSHVPWGGFGWGGAGYALAPYGAARGAAQWIGGSGWTVLIVGLAAAIVLWVDSQEWRPAAAVAGISAVLLLAGAVAPTVATGSPVRVAIVQGSTNCPGEHCDLEREMIYANHLELTRTIEPDQVDLVVWAESSTGGSVHPLANPQTADEIGAEAVRLDAWFIVGGDYFVSDTEFVNANLLFSPQGQIVDEYRKQHPVPFGEFVPFRDFFTSIIPALSQVPRDMVRGEEPGVFDTDLGEIGTVISFEASFARHNRAAISSGGQLLVVATNQGSYLESPASVQLMGITRMSAGELGVDVAHGAVTGRSTMITNGGDLGPIADMFGKEIIFSDLKMHDASPTLYTRWGDWLQLVMAGAAVLVVLMSMIGLKASAAPVSAVDN